MATRYTIADGDILSDAGVWDGDGSVPGAGDTAMIEHACGMSAGAFQADIGEGASGTLSISGAGARSFAGSVSGTFRIIEIAGGTVTFNGPLTPSRNDGTADGLVYISGGTVIVNASVTGGNGSSGDSLVGLNAIAQSGGTLTVNADVTGGDSEDAWPGGLGILCTGGALTINGEVRSGTGANGLNYSGTPAIIVHGSCRGLHQRQGFYRESGSASITVYGIVAGDNSGGLTLTGAISNTSADRWLYDVREGLTLNLSGLALTNSGRVVIFANGGTVTTDSATRIDNQEGAQAAAIACDVAMQWAAGGLNAAEVQAACAAALADYDPPTQAELQATAAALQTHGDAHWPTAQGFATPGSAMTLLTSERAALAAALLTADVAGVIEAGAAAHSLCYLILAASQFSTERTPGKLSVFRADGQTVFAEKTIHSQSSTQVITGME